MPTLSSRALSAVFAAIVFGALAAAAHPTRAEVFNPETFTLENGMQVVVVSNHRAPVVTHMVWYRVGAMDEPPGKSGIAHFLEHLMFKGTKTREPGEFSRLVARNGGRENAFTGRDFTGYFQTVAKDRLPLVMELEADRMRNLVFDPAEVEPERLVVLEERRQRVENDPASILGEHVTAALFRNHPYQRPIIGWEHEIKAITNDDLRAFYRQWYAPNNAILAVSGDITAAELRPLAETYYGAIPAQPLAERVDWVEPPQQAARRVELRDPRVRQPSWSRSYLAPGYSTDGQEHADALQVLAEILGGGATSRLYRTLVVENGQAVSAGAGYDPSARGPTRFVIYASPRPGVSLVELEGEISDIVRQFVNEGPTVDEVTRATERMRANAAYARDSQRAGARTLGAALVIGRTVEDVESWPDRIAAVTPEQVAEAARAVFDERRSVTALLRPAPNDQAEAR